MVFRRDGTGTMMSAPALTAFAVVAAATLMSVTDADAQVRGNAQAEQSRTLRDQGPAFNLLPPGRYESESGEAFFVGRSGDTPLFRFERRQETWLLRPSPAPRGDTIYRNDAGAQILRVTPSGSITLFTTRAPAGSPASMTGPAPDLAPPRLGPVQLFNLIARSSSQISRALGRLVYIEVDTGSDSEALSVEALIITTEAVVRMARSPTTRGQLERLRSISISEGPRPQVTYVRGELRIAVNPAISGGRPSSARVIQAVASAD